jgi:hypothetical protein
MSAQSQKPIDFATEGLRLALRVERNCGIRVHYLWAVRRDSTHGLTEFIFTYRDLTTAPKSS